MNNTIKIRGCYYNINFLNYNKIKYWKNNKKLCIMISNIF